MTSLVELDLYKKLQPLFKEKMGDWQVGDWYYEINLDYQSGGRICVVGCNSHPNNINKIALHLPLPIDPRNPERGLWEMVDWDSASLEMGDNGTLRKRFRFAELPPTLALLKALEAQKGL